MRKFLKWIGISLATVVGAILVLVAVLVCIKHSTIRVLGYLIRFEHRFVNGFKSTVLTLYHQGSGLIFGAPDVNVLQPVSVNVALAHPWPFG